MPSATELPSWVPQHTLLYAKRVFEDANVGGKASAYANVSRGRKMNIGVHQSGIVGGKGYTVIMHGVDVVEVIQRGLHVTRCRLICVGGKEGFDRGDVRACSR